MLTEISGRVKSKHENQEFIGTYLKVSIANFVNRLVKKNDVKPLLNKYEFSYKISGNSLKTYLNHYDCEGNCVPMHAFNGIQTAT